MNESLGEAFPKEIERCKELREAYKEIGPAGQFGLMFINAIIEEAEEAQAAGDVVAMIRIYPEMQECQ